MSILFVIPFSSSAQEDSNLSCDNINFVIQGPQVSLPNSDYTYLINVAIIATGETLLDDSNIPIVPNDIVAQSRIQREVLQDTRVIKRQTSSWFTYNFPTLGRYTITALIRYQSCNYEITKLVDTYEQVYTYIGPFVDDFNYGVLDNIKDTDQIFYTYIPVETTTKTSQMFIQASLAQLDYIRASEDIFRGAQNYALLFDLIHRLESDYNINMSNKNIFVIDNTNKTIVKTFLARFIKEYEVKNIYVVNDTELSQILLDISVGKPAYTSLFLENAHVGFASRRRISLGHVMDYLLFHGFPLDTLVLLLSVIFALVIIVFFKQVIGLGSFGVYYPLLFAFALHTVGPKTSIGLLLLAIAAKMTVGLISRKFTLLATAKIGLQVGLYVIYTLFALSLYKLLNNELAQFNIFANQMILIAYISLLLVGAKIWISTTSSGIRKQILPLIWFWLISILIFFILTSSGLHRFLLINPSVILLGLLLIVFMGRYNGLQLVEYIRFWPLIRYIQKQKKRK
jgi:hypothetical protein